MSQERIAEIRDFLFCLERKMKPLEWDSSRNQINEYKKIQLDKLKVEHSTLLEELDKLEQDC